MRVRICIKIWKSVEVSTYVDVCEFGGVGLEGGGGRGIGSAVLGHDNGKGGF